MATTDPVTWTCRHCGWHHHNDDTARCMFCARFRRDPVERLAKLEVVREVARRRAAEKFPPDPIDCPYCAEPLENRSCKLFCRNHGPVLTCEDL